MYCIVRIKHEENANTIGKQEVAGTMPKDSQIDPKDVRKQKAKGGPTIASDAPDGEGRNAKKHSIPSQGFQSKQENR